MFCFPGDHQNNNKSFSNGTCSSVFFPSPTLNPQLSLGYDYRYDTCFVCLITRRKVREGVQSYMWTKYRPEQGKLSEGFYFDPHSKIKRDYSLLLMSLFLAALHSICSSSQPCWFTTVTCTQDILSRTAVAPPRLTSPSVLSGFGCRTTRCEKPACTRSCLPTLTCFSTSGCKD